MRRSFNIDLDYHKRLTITELATAKSHLKSCSNGSKMESDRLASAILTLCCAVKKSQGFCPRTTQLVALTLLVISNNKSVSRLLEVMTGEGKSTVIAMLAAVLAIQGKKVDIITSSPILACRDAEEWEPFFYLLDLRATHNIATRVALASDPDKERQLCYKNPIVYGTVSNFAADILREEFEQKNVRSDRKFDAVIADEVDLLMLDEGVQFTYLSHKSAILYHMETVVATVWAVIGQYSPVTARSGEILYIGTPKLFSDTIFESIHAEECAVKESSNFLVIAQQNNLLDKVKVEKLMGTDEEGTTDLKKEEHQELKKNAMITIESGTIIALLKKLEEYLPYTFEAYVISGDGMLELASKELPADEVTDSDKEASDVEEKLPIVRILVIGNGMACTLNTQTELKAGSMAKIEATLLFSNELDSAEDQKNARLKVPLFLKEFVESQLSVYINSAMKCLEMVENREYAVSSDGKIIPVDFLNSGVMQMNKKWGGGLQQMLEMKHNLSLSSLSVVTNFLSHMELFSRYKNNGGVIFGLSGTLDMDSPSTAKVLFDLFQVRSCVIPTHKRRKLYEKPAMIVEGENLEWFKKIMDVIHEAVQPEPWKKGRAVLVLCEDIKTAVELNQHITDKEGYDKNKVHLYAHSNSKELQSIQHKFNPGEIAIATNLAGRGTNIKLTEEVKSSGGLLCLVTFLARNRRVELQAFGRCARKGEPGSVQCVLKAASLPAQYQGLDIATIKRLRAEREHIRLDELLNSEVKVVKLKEVLFKRHCKYLKAKNTAIVHREDKSITIDAINESWGQWLLMKSDEIEHLSEEKLTSELTEAHSKWPICSFYCEIQFGNKMLTEGKEKCAYQHYTSSIRMEPRYVAIAYYNRAYATITMRKDDYMNDAISDLVAAEKSLESYISEVAYLLQCVPMVTRMKQSPQRNSDKLEDFDTSDSENGASSFSAQMQLRIQIFGFVRDKIREAIGKIEQFKKEGEDIEAESLGVFSLIPNADYVTNQELYTMWSLGMEVVFSVRKKPRFCWEGLVVLLIGFAQIIAGVALAVLTVGTAANIGMGLISEGISDCIDGVVAMSIGEFSWAEWGISKAIGIAVSLASGGIARFTSKGFNAFKLASKLGKELKAIPKIAKNSWGLAAKANFKNVTKFVGKTVVEDSVMRGLSYVQNAAFKAFYDKIGEECKNKLRGDLHKTLTSGKLEKIVDSYFICQLPAAYVKEDKMSPALRKKAHDFFSNVGADVVETVVEDPFIKEQLTSASLSLLSNLSGKHKGGKVAIIEAAEMSALVIKTMKDLNDLLERLVPDTEQVCQAFAEKNPPPESGTDVASYSHLRCVADLKNELVDLVGDVFSTAIATFLEQNLGSVVNHGLNRTVHHAGRKVLKKYMRTNITYEAIKAGQKANFIRSVDPSKFSGHVPPIGSAMVDHYKSKIADTRKPGSVLELKIAVEHYGQGVTIFQEKKGKFIRDCSVEPSSGKKIKSGAKIELLYTPPSDDKSVGHYDVIIKGKVVKIESEDSNCLFQAFAGGRNPDLTSTAESLLQLQRHALEVRENVAGSIDKNPQLWVNHISSRLELIQLRNGNRFALLGAGPKNELSKVSSDMYTEFAKRKEVHTVYDQENGIQCTAVRRFEKEVRRDSENNLRSADGTPLSRMTSLHNHMEGLNFNKNKGRCWVTKPVTGMIKRDGGKARDSEVSFHLSPSEAGANAGNEYANAVMASPYYNRLEREVWSPKVRKMIGKADFSMTTKVETEPLIPKGVQFKNFFRNINTERRKQKRDPIHATNEAALKHRLEEMQRIDPRAYRVKELKIEIKVGSKSETITMNRDVDLFVPSDFTKKNQQYQIPGEILSKSQPKISDQKVNKPPEYRKPPPKPTAKKRKAFDQRVSIAKKRLT